MKKKKKKKDKKREREIIMLNEVWHGGRQQAPSDAEKGEIEYGNIEDDVRNEEEIEEEKIIQREKGEKGKGEEMDTYSTVNDAYSSIPSGPNNDLKTFENNISNKNGITLSSNSLDVRSTRNLHSSENRRPSTESSLIDRKRSSNHYSNDRQNLSSATATIPELVLVPLRDKTLYESPMPHTQPHTSAQHMTEKQFLDWSLREKEKPAGLNSMKSSSSSSDQNQNLPRKKNLSQKKDFSQLSSMHQLFDKEHSPRKRLESFQLNERGEYSLLSPIRPNTGQHGVINKNFKNDNISSDKDNFLSKSSPSSFFSAFTPLKPSSSSTSSSSRMRRIEENRFKETNVKANTNTNINNFINKNASTNISMTLPKDLPSSSNPNSSQKIFRKNATSKNLIPSAPYIADLAANLQKNISDYAL